MFIQAGTSRFSALVFAILGISLSLSAGTLTPPGGSPASTMKPLSQVEPRTPITALPIIISTRGSYYLVSNLTGSSGSSGITITTDDVTIDLAGFTLLGVTGSQNGINISGTRSNIHIRNGVIKSWGQAGINGLFARTSEFEHLRLTLNNDGIKAAVACNIHDCQTESNAATGISASASTSIINCASTGNTTGISVFDHCTIRDCRLFVNSGAAISAGDTCIISGCEVDGGSGVVLSGGIHTGNSCVFADSTVYRVQDYALTGGTHCSLKNCIARNCLLDGFNFGQRCSFANCISEGNSQSGFLASNDTLAADCIATSNSKLGMNLGVSCVVRHCVANSNGDIGIFADLGSTIMGCSAQSNGNGIGATGHDGIQTASNCSVLDCTANANTGDGIAVLNRSRVERCHAFANNSDGIQAGGQGILINNDCHNNAGGVHVQFNDVRVEGNTVTSNARGIDIDASGNLVIRNSASGNTTNFDIVANNKVGTIVSAPDSVAISGSTGGAGVGSTDPWANFSF